jgi:predicted O-methyltransferase YrrM
MIGHIRRPEGHFYADLIVQIVKLTGCETYLELGTYFGYTMQKVAPLVKRAICVDIVDMRVEKVGEFYQCTTDKFFEYFHDRVDIIFIDADHHSESGKRDFDHSIRLLNKHGIIILHDTDPIDKASTDFNLCGDIYKVVDYIQETYPDVFNMVTLPINDMGLTIVNRKIDRRVFSYLENEGS